MMGALRKIVHVLALPLRRSGDGGLVIQAYRGFGSRKRAYVTGRVLRQPYFGIGRRDRTVQRDLIDLGRRFFRRGAADVTVRARFGNTTSQVQTDKDGFFRIDLRFNASPPDHGVWHEMALSTDGTDAATATAAVFIPLPAARFAVVSDIDDTVVFTGVANKIMMIWRLFVTGAKSRAAFPGVASFYAGLHKGASGAEGNPMLYVSRGPWSLYEVLETFFAEHRIPHGPVLFLRHWGLTLQSPLPRRAVNHKLDLIRVMLSIYDDLPFVLIGDSGQRDPEIYERLVRERPGRIQIVYIRDVSRRPKRADAIAALARDLAAEGSSLLLAGDTFTMAQHAAEHGLINDRSLKAVLAEKREEQSV